jgi:hypothetical protein
MKLKTFIIAALPATLIFAAGWLLSASSVSKDAITAARHSLEQQLGTMPATGTLIVVDFTQPSQTRRFEVINMASGNIEFSGRMAHGKNSGNVYAIRFSDDIGSLQSSLGLFEVSEIFTGMHGASLQLQGLEKSLNGNAEIRGIIIHAAPYVSLPSILMNWKENFRLGRSEGCFAISEENLQKLLSGITWPAYLYAYYGNQGPQ